MAAKYKAFLDVDGSLFEAGMGLLNSTPEPQVSWSCAATQKHVEKYVTDVVWPNVGPIPITLVSGDRRTTNFRKLLCPEYKANRKDKPRPANELEVQDFLKNKYGCWLASGQEADDLLGIVACEDPDNTLIISGDGDLSMIPANHLRPQKWNQKWCRGPFKVTDPGVMYFENIKVDKKTEKLVAGGVFVTGVKCFYYKLLAGDSSDGVKFIYGIGPKKAYELLQHAHTEEQMCEVVKKEFKKIYQDTWEETLTLAGRLLWVRRKWNEMWEIPF